MKEENTKFLEQANVSVQSALIQIQPVVADSSEITGRHVILLVSGIYSNGNWADELVRQPEDLKGVRYEFKRLRTDLLGAGRLFTRYRLGKVREIIKVQILNAIIEILLEDGDAAISIIGHSLGTDILADVLPEIRYKFEYIIFVGAICKTKKENTVLKTCKTLINDRGSRDRYCLLAALLVPWHYEPTGTFGFRTGYANDAGCFRNDHDSCAEKPHIINAILPRMYTDSTLPSSLYEECVFSFAWYYRNRWLFWILLVFTASIWATNGLWARPSWLAYLPIATLLSAVCIPIFYLTRHRLRKSNT